MDRGREQDHVACLSVTGSTGVTASSSEQLTRVRSGMCCKQDERERSVEVREQSEQLRGAAGVGDKQDGVVRPYLAEVAVQSLGRVQEGGVDAQAVEGGDELAADVTRLADANHHNLAASAAPDAVPSHGDDGPAETVSGNVIGRVQAGQALQGRGFSREDVHSSSKAIVIDSNRTRDVVAASPLAEVEVFYGGAEL